MRALGNILLAVWLILEGLISLLNLSFSGSDLIMAILAIVAGVMLLLGRGNIKFSRNLGILLLSIWLILFGLLPLIGISFSADYIVLGVLAISA